MIYNFDYCKTTIKEINEALTKNDFVILYGEAGTGKSSLIKYMIENDLFLYDKRKIVFFSNLHYKYCEEKIHIDSSNLLFIIDNFDFVDNSQLFENFKMVRKILNGNNKVLLIQRKAFLEHDYKCKIVKMPLINASTVRSFLLNESNKKIAISEKELAKISRGSIVILNILIDYLNSDYNESLKDDFFDILLENDSEVVSRLLYLYAVKFYKLNKYQQAEEILFDIMSINSDDEMAFQVFEKLSEIKEKQNKYEESILMLKQAIKRTNNSLKIVDSYNGIGGLYIKLKDYVSAKESFEFALSIVSSIKKSDAVTEMKIKTIVNLASVETQEGKYRKSLELLEKANKLSGNLDNPYYKIAILNNKASVLAKQCEELKAIRCYDQAMKIIKNEKKSQNGLITKLQTIIIRNSEKLKAQQCNVV